MIGAVGHHQLHNSCEVLSMSHQMLTCHVFVICQLQAVWKVWIWHMKKGMEGMRVVVGGMVVMVGIMGGAVSLLKQENFEEYYYF